MPSLLIAGCGYVGQATADLFHEAGWRVEGWTRSRSDVVRPYRLASVDITDAKQVLAQSREFDAVIHCASTRGGDAELYRHIYFEGVRNLIHAFPGSMMLFTSSTSVYGQTDGDWVTEESETSPARATSQVLLDTEQLVLGHGGILARLGGIYGPGRSALLDKFLGGRGHVEADYWVNQIHRDDIASALLFLLGQPKRTSGIHNVTDGNPILVSECYRWLERRLGPLKAPGESVPTLRKRGSTNKRVDNAKLRGLGWTLRYPTFAEGMEKSVLPERGLSG